MDKQKPEREVDRRDWPSREIEIKALVVGGPADGRVYPVSGGLEGYALVLMRHSGKALESRGIKNAPSEDEALRTYKGPGISGLSSRGPESGR